MGEELAPVYVGLAPMLPVTDVTRAIRFYEELGFKVGISHAPEANGDPVWAWLFNGQAHLMVSQSDGPIDATHSSASIWIYTRDVERAHQVLSSRGMSVGDIEHPFYNPRGEFHVHDPDGHAIFIAHAD